MAMESITAIDPEPSDIENCAMLSLHLNVSVEPICNSYFMCGFYEDLEKEVTLFLAGEQDRFWYTVLCGSLKVRYYAQQTPTARKYNQILAVSNSIMSKSRFKTREIPKCAPD